ncbi:response regulator [Planococcus halotolerans]|uniref:DNA-binding response regulator n=1 Tax=Planococcus halotolerans TaxID=2233542 RepID=A0A365KUE3_9BACL|nr:response regulator transcription factor [Planococcus halotolerans]QHJ71356.1 response regulator [Planococcus halotolerans]RAZ76789.1 DNA-binding response regulator [Planococcus halotolerans]
MSVQKIDLLVLDSHPLFREGLKRILEMDPYLQVIAEGETGEQLMPLYRQYQPDVVLMEINLPSKTGIEALSELTQHFPHAKVLIFTVVDDFFYVSQAIQAGASGYLLKEMDPAAIVQAIKTVVKGGFYLHPKVTKDFIGALNRLGLASGGPFLQTTVIRPYHLLTARECGVLQLMADGHSNRSLGEALEISEKTVKNHVSSILRKMELQDRTQAVVIAIKNGWVALS